MNAPAIDALTPARIKRKSRIKDVSIVFIFKGEQIENNGNGQGDDNDGYDEGDYR